MDVYTHIGQEVEELIERCLVFNSADGDYYGTGVVTDEGQGILFLDHEWSNNALAESVRLPLKT